MPLQKLGSQKSLLLLAYLVSNPQEQSRARLAALFWPDQPDDKAKGNLRWAINNLANLLPNALEATRHTLQFRHSDGFWVDVIDFAQLLADNQPQSLAAAVELYRGDFLDGIAVDDSSELELWLLQTREGWRQRTITALERLIASNLKQKHMSAAQTWLSRLLNLQPWHEEAHCQLMQLLAETGQRSAALAQFELCRNILAAEVAAQPSEKTLALFRQIQTGDFDRQQEAAQLPTQRHNLPRERTPFVGRTQQLEQLRTLIFEQQHPLITLSGEGGVGKSRLALATARTLLDDDSGETEGSQLAVRSERFANGIWFVPLAAVEANNDLETSLVTAIADAMQLKFVGARPPKSQLLDLLRGKQLLLLLDNFEHLVEGAPLLTQILDAAPEAQLLVTSRTPLELLEERRFPLTGLQLPAENADLSATQSESIALFTQSARRVVPDFAMDEANAQPLRAICRYVRGLPLALELAATWLAHMDCHEIASEIEQGLDFLSASLRNVPERHRNMRAVFEYSWRLLSEVERLAAMEMAIFRGGCERQAAQQITQRPPPTLSALIDKSMLQRDEQGRFVQHELLRQFCLEKLQTESGLASEQFRALQDRHSDYYLRQLQQTEPILKGHERLSLLAKLRRDLDNLRQAWRWALAQQNWQRIEQSLSALALFYATSGLLREGSSALLDGFHLLQNDATQDDAAARQRCLLQLLPELANLEMQQGDYVATLSHLDVADRLLEQFAAPDLQAVAIRILVLRAEVRWYKGEIDKAEDRLRQALLQLESSQRTADADNQENYADILCLRGLIAVRGGDYLQAVDWYDQSHLLSLKLGDAYRTGRALYCLGTAYRNQGKYERAQHYLLQGLEISRQTGDGHSEGRILNTLGDIALYRGDFGAAQRHYLSVERFAQQIGDRRSESIAHTNLGIVERELGNLGGAERYFRQSRATAQSISFQRGEGWNLLCLSLLHQQTGNYERALALAEQGAAIFDQLGDRLGHAHSATNLGRSLAGLGKLEEATVQLKRALHLREELHQPHLLAEMRAWLASVVYRQGDATQAARYLQQLLDYLQNGSLDGMEEPLRVCRLGAEVLQALGDKRSEWLLEKGNRLQERRV